MKEAVTLSRAWRLFQLFVSGWSLRQSTLSLHGREVDENRENPFAN